MCGFESVGQALRGPVGFGFLILGHGQSSMPWKYFMQITLATITVWLCTTLPPASTPQLAKTTAPTVDDIASKGSTPILYSSMVHCGCPVECGLVYTQSIYNSLYINMGMGQDGEPLCGLLLNQTKTRTVFDLPEPP